MKCIIRNYGRGMTTEQRQTARAEGVTAVLTRGTAKAPRPPRDLLLQAGPRGVLLNWRMPEGFNADIAGFRVYKDNENSLFSVISDPTTRQVFIETTSGTTPQVTNFFVSSVNQLGAESPLVSKQGSAIAETSAPAMPSTPPTYQAPTPPESGKGRQKQ